MDQSKSPVFRSHIGVTIHQGHRVVRIIQHVCRSGVRSREQLMHRAFANSSRASVALTDSRTVDFEDRCVVGAQVSAEVLGEDDDTELAVVATTPHFSTAEERGSFLRHADSLDDCGGDAAVAGFGPDGAARLALGPSVAHLVKSAGVLESAGITGTYFRDQRRWSGGRERCRDAGRTGC